MTSGPLGLVAEVAQLLDDLEIPYAVGGSLASSLVGEPRSTVDADIAVRVAPDREAELLERAAAASYVPLTGAREAIRAHTSFNLVDTERGLKVDLFVLGDGLLDRMQIERRIRVAIPGLTREIWITSPEDQVLRKLEWYRDGGSVSDRQWRDVVAILRTRSGALDTRYLTATARAVGLAVLLAEALRQAEANA
jgi:hypothetical protein